MTNKQFFLATIHDEQPIFIKVIKALPHDKLDYKPDEKARTAGKIAFQLASQPFFMAAVAKTGSVDWGTYHEPEHPDVDAMTLMAEKNFTDLKATIEATSDEDWDNGKALMEYPGGKWETTRYGMVWGFLFDAIHHRGQLTTYLRAMGAKVPSVYGGSADEPAG